MPRFVNPAEALRETVRAALPGAMLKWDASGRALLVSDAPRRAGYDPAALAGLRVQEAAGLLYIDWQQEAYCAPEYEKVIGPWHADWFAEQALLAGILARRGAGAADEGLLRGAYLACAQGEKAVRQSIAALRRADATALRCGAGAGVWAAAAFVAAWLWAQQGIGLPQVEMFRREDCYLRDFRV